MNNKLKKILWIVIAAIILLIIGIIIAISKWNISEKKTTQVDNLDATETEVYNCVDQSDMECTTNNYVQYKFFEYKKDLPYLKEFFEQLNTDTEQRMIKDKQDLITKYPECSSLYDKYIYRNMTSNFVYYYEDETRDVISITNEIKYRDFCTGEEKVSEDVYLYSKEDQDFITSQNDMFKKFRYTKEQINEIIVNYSKKYLNVDVDVDKIEEYKLFYNSYGQLIIKYRYKDSAEWQKAHNRK